MTSNEKNYTTSMKIGRVKALLKQISISAAVSSFVGKLSVALVEQVVFSGSSFLFQVYLIRKMGLVAFGEFSVMMSVLLGVSTVYSALVINPLLILGPGNYASRFKQYMPRLFFLHWVVAGIASFAAFCLIAILATYAISETSLSLKSALCGAIALLFILFNWLSRRTAYSAGRAPVALCSSLTYSGLLFGMLIGLDQLDHITVETAFFSLGIAGGTSGAVAFIILRGMGNEDCGPVYMTDVIVKHWSMGRWMLPTGILRWIPVYGFITLIPALASLSDAAEFRIMVLLTLPLTLLVTGASGVLQPRLVRAWGRSGVSKSAVQTIVVSIAVGLGYAALLFCIGPRMLSALLQDETLITWDGLCFSAGLSVLILLTNILGLVLKASERVHQETYIAALIAAVALSAGIPTLITYGIGGLFITTISCYVVGCILALIFVRSVLSYVER